MVDLRETNLTDNAEVKMIKIKRPKASVVIQTLIVVAVTLLIAFVASLNDFSWGGL